ncbi:MAG: TRAP transporter substrate-binding protein [Cognatishimia sp.]
MLKSLRAMAVAAATLSAGAAAAGELKLAHFMSTKHPDHNGVFLPMGEKLATATNGDVTLRVYPGGELGAGPRDQYARAVDGIADLAFALPGYTASTFPMTLLVELPGAVADANKSTEALWANVDHLAKEFRRAELIGLWTNPPAVIYSREKPIRTLADLAGLKIRVPSRNAGLVVEAWGGTPVSMPAPGMYNALQTGVIDGALIDQGSVLSFKLGEVTKYMTVGMQSQISPFMVVMNRDSFDGLSADEQAKLKEIGREMSLVAQANRVGAAKKGADVFAGMEGHELITLSDEEAAKFDAASAALLENVVADLEGQGLKAADFVAALQAD